MIVPCLWVSWHDEILARGYADQGLLERILDRSIWRPPGAIAFDHREVRGDFPDVLGALVVINARTHAKDAARLRAELDRLDFSVVLLCGDEEWDFPWQEIHDPENERRRVWAMQARPEHQALGWRFLPGGWYPRTDEYLDALDFDAERPLAWFFAGQITHARRQEAAAVLRALRPDQHLTGKLYETDHYLAEAVPRAEYFELMAQAKVIPCPSGPYSTDCARTFEALEAGCVPVTDSRSAFGPAFDYDRLLFDGDVPWPSVRDWGEFPAKAREIVKDWPETANRSSARWQQFKRSLAHRLDDDLYEVSGIPRALATPDDRITVVVTTSPVPLHPSTEHLEETIGSIREQLPDAEIILAADGLRAEQSYRAKDYAAYLHRLCWLTEHRWHNVVPLLMPHWAHQAGTTRAALELVTTPLILFVEHDTPLVNEIPWGALCNFVESGEANLVRFHHEAEVLEPHRHLMLGPAQRVGGSGHAEVRAGMDDWIFDTPSISVQRTIAWWQRPHLASTRFYREQVMAVIDPSSRTMIEDALYPHIVNRYADYGEAEWWNWRLYQYAPEGNMLRSRHLDSRGSDRKWPSQIAHRR